MEENNVMTTEEKKEFLQQLHEVADSIRQIDIDKIVEESKENTDVKTLNKRIDTNKTQG